MKSCHKQLVINLPTLPTSFIEWDIRQGFRAPVAPLNILLDALIRPDLDAVILSISDVQASADIYSDVIRVIELTI